jgi:hypothetical protein
MINILKKLMKIIRYSKNYNKISYLYSILKFIKLILNNYFVLTIWKILKRIFNISILIDILIRGIEFVLYFNGLDTLISSIYIYLNLIINDLTNFIINKIEIIFKSKDKEIINEQSIYETKINRDNYKNVDIKDKLYEEDNSNNYNFIIIAVILSLGFYTLYCYYPNITEEIINYIKNFFNKGDDGNNSDNSLMNKTKEELINELKNSLDTKVEFTKTMENANKIIKEQNETIKNILDPSSSSSSPSSSPSSSSTVTPTSTTSTSQIWLKDKNFIDNIKKSFK